MNRSKPPGVLSRRALLAACTGLLALAFSAIPALALWLDDARLLAQPHERTRQAGALALSSDDLYLTRILKKSGQQRDSLNAEFSRLTNPGSMSWASNESVLDYLYALHGAGVLPAEWLQYCGDRIEHSFVSSDRLGFFHYTAYAVDPDRVGSEFCYTVGVSVEGESKKAVGVWLSVPATLSLPAPQRQATLEAYRAYLGLEQFEDWEDPVDTWFGGSALYSPRAELMLFCETGSYQTHTSAGFPVYGGGRTDHECEHSYFCLNAAFVPEETVRGWQKYARSFTGEADAWRRGSAAGEADVWHRDPAFGEADAETVSKEVPLG